MFYICHRPYKGNTEAGIQVDIRIGERFPVIAKRIARNNASICTITSYVAHQYFAVDDDRKGLERGYLTYRIAFAPREKDDGNGHVFRFSPEELQMLWKDYGHWLKQEEPLLFNHDFFQADVKELRELARKLGDRDVD